MIVVAGMFLVRFALGPLSYAAATPGGLFAPMLVLGAQCGLFLGALFCYWFPYLGEPPIAFAVVGMAAFFTAVVRAPLTGIILVTEMTGCFTLLLPMLLACFAAMTVPTMLGDPPIYDSLRTPSLARVAPLMRKIDELLFQETRMYEPELPWERQRAAWLTPLGHLTTGIGS